MTHIFICTVMGGCGICIKCASLQQSNSQFGGWELEKGQLEQAASPPSVVGDEHISQSKYDSTAVCVLHRKQSKQSDFAATVIEN